jgi:hypothetical protein
MFKKSAALIRKMAHNVDQLDKIYWKNYTKFFFWWKIELFVDIIDAFYGGIID